MAEQHSTAAEHLKLVAYCRVSSNAQVERDTVSVQRKELERWAKRRGHRIVRWCTDEAVSGTVEALARPGLSCALEAVEKGHAAALVLTKLDRLARDLTTQEATLALFWKAGGRVVTTEQGEVLADDPTDPIRTAMRQMAGAFAQLERGMIRLRMENGRSDKREKGGYVGGAPRYGEKAEGKALVINEDEKATVDQLLALRRSEMSYRQIAAELNARGRVTKHGHQWLAPTVRRVCVAAGL